jgi:hypothetical protein
MEIDPRKEKRAFRKMGMDDPCEEAYRLGIYAMEFPKGVLPARLLKNPYPAGRRHNEWNRGFKPD